MTGTWGSCPRCGCAAPPGDRFCQRCGAPLPAPPLAGPTPVMAPIVLPGAAVATPTTEPIIGHLAAEFIQPGKRLLGGTKSTTVNLVVTTARLLVLSETPESNDAWLGASEGLEEQSHRTGVPLRTLVETFNWAAPEFGFIWRSTPDSLLADDRSNWSLPLLAITSATVTLADELDRLDLVMDNGQTLPFTLYNSTGLPAARLLGSVLGPRVRVVS